MAVNRDRVLKPLTKLRKLLKDMNGLPKPDEVHDLRTNTRRIEAMFKALSTKGVKQTQRDLKKLRRLAGKVRDRDVLLAYAFTLKIKGEEKCQAQLVEALTAKRRRQAQRLGNEVQQLRTGLRKELKQVGTRLDELAQQPTNQSAPSLEEDTPAANAAQLVLGLAEPRQLNAQNLHSYRLQLKELRYVLTLADNNATQAFVDDLAKVQDAIGEWHDWSELAAIAAKVISHKKRCALETELKKVTATKLTDALQSAEALRKQYLRATKGSKAAASKKVPSGPAWKATATLDSPATR